MVKVRACRSVLGAWPSIGMNNESFFVHLVFNLPDFLETNAIMLRVFAFIQFIFCNKFFAQVSSAAFTKYSIFRLDIYACFKSRFLLAFQANTHVSGSYTDHLIVFIKNFTSREAWEYFYSKLFGLGCQPSTKIG